MIDRHLELLFHSANGVVFLATGVFAVTEAVGAAIVAGIFSVVNTFLLLAFQRQSRKDTQEMHEDVKKRRTVVATIPNGEHDDDATLVITPEDRRELEDRRAVRRAEHGRREHD